MSDDKRKYTIKQLLEIYGGKILPYMQDDSNLSLTLNKHFSHRIVVLCESIDQNMINPPQPSKPLNHLQILGELHAAVAKPMPQVNPGSWWIISVISEDFGLIDIFHIRIPEDLKQQSPLGDTIDVLSMKERPPCLMDLYYVGNFTWPLRFTVNNLKITVVSKESKLKNLPKFRQRDYKVEKKEVEAKKNLPTRIDRHVKKFLSAEKGIRIQ